jgi:hypothetical protein
MGKLSKADAEAMIASYRAQAINVIREIDRKDGADASTREQIAREVRARLEVAKTKQVADAERRSAGKRGKKGASAAGKKAESADEPADEPAEAAQTDPPEETAAAGAEEAAASAEGAAADPSSVEPRVPSQDAGAAKEATP